MPRKPHMPSNFLFGQTQEFGIFKVFDLVSCPSPFQEWATLITNVSAGPAHVVIIITWLPDPLEKKLEVYPIQKSVLDFLYMQFLPELIPVVVPPKNVQPCPDIIASTLIMASSSHVHMHVHVNPAAMMTTRTDLLLCCIQCQRPSIVF